MAYTTQYYNLCKICGGSAVTCLCASVNKNQSPYRTYVFGRNNFDLQAVSLPTKTSTEPLVGLRVWNLDRKTGTLRSTYQSQFTWPFRKPLCKDGIKDAGIHAVKKGERILKGWGPSFRDPANLAPGLWQEYKADVAGKIYMWGTVTEHTEGYTAEFAYPKELWMPENTDPLIIMQLEHNYGVPVLLRDDLPPHPPKEASLDINTVKAAMHQLSAAYPPILQFTMANGFVRNKLL